MDLGVGEMRFIFCGKNTLLVTRNQVSDPRSMDPLVFLIFSIFHREPYGPPLSRSWTQGVQLLDGRGPIAYRVGSIPEFLRKLNATCDFSFVGWGGSGLPSIPILILP